MKKHLLLLLYSLLAVWNLHAQQSVGYKDNWWKPNGTVYAVVRSGNTVYLGGSFTYIGPWQPYGVALNTGTAQVNTSYVVPNGNVKVSVPDGVGGWYIGGDFTQVGGQTRNRVARINADGTLHAWNPNANSTVNTLAVSGSTVYAGGQFGTIGGQIRNYIAALDTGTGNATSWNPFAQRTVNALLVSGNKVYVGGQFGAIGGQTRSRIAALDATTGNATSWNPNVVNGQVLTLVLCGRTIIAGGNFSTVSGQTRNNIAAIDTTYGSATAWNPNADYTVNALAVSGSTVYAGGQFSRIGGQTRNNIAALDTTTGNATSWNPSADNTVNALLVSSSTVYAGGSFTTIGGQSRSRIAAIDSTTGNATSWNPDASNYVTSLAVSGSTVYAGGAFTSIGGRSRNNLAALDTTTGMPTSWNPNANSFINSLVISGSTVYAGGTFTSIGGQSRNNLAALDMGTGNATSWNPNANNPVSALALSGGTVYAGGLFTTIGGQSRTRIAALDTNTGMPTSWSPNANNPVSALAVSGNTVYAGGQFTNIGGQSRNYIAALDATTGAATSWNPSADGRVYVLALSGSTVYVGGAFTSIGGQSRSYLAALDSTTGNATSWNPNSNSVVNALAVSGSTVYAGGAFTSIGGQSRNRIAAIDATTGNATSWNPNSNSAVNALAVCSSTVYAGGAFSSMNGDASRRYFMPLVDSTAIPPSISIAASDTTICTGASVTFTATPMGATSPTYQWTKNGTAISGETAATYTTSTLANGDSIACQMIDGSTAVTSNAIGMTVNALPNATLTASGPTTFCEGDSVEISAPAGAVSYEWSITYNAQGTNIVTLGNASTTATTSSSYSVTVTDSNGCSASSNVIDVTVNLRPNATLTANGPTTFCVGGSVTFNAPAGMASYQWNISGNAISNAANASYTANAAGSYSVTVTDTSGCTATSVDRTVIVNMPVTPSVSIAASANPIAPGTSVTFTATPTNGGSNPQYQWRQNGSVVGGHRNVFTTSSLANGDTIICILTSNAPCATTPTASSNAIQMNFGYCAASANMQVGCVITNVTVAGINNLGTGSGTAGYENFTSITGTMQIGTSYPLNLNVTPVYYEVLQVWIDYNQDYDFDDAGEEVFRVQDIMSTSYGGTIVVPATALPGTTRMRVRVSDVNGNYAFPCGASVYGNIEDYTINITAPCPAQSVVATASTLTACEGSPITFTATPTNGGATPQYQWMVNGTAISGATGATYTDSFRASNVQVSVVMTPTTPCPSTPTVESSVLNVTVNDCTPVISAVTPASSSVCQRSTLAISFTAFGTFNAGNVFTAQLSNASGSFANPTTIGTLTGTSSGTINASLGSTPAGTGYRVRIVSSNPATTSADNGSNIVVMSAPGSAQVAISPATAVVCAGSSITLSVPATPGFTYQWQTGGADIAGATANTFTASPAATTSYRCVVTNANGCASSSAAKSVTVKTPPVFTTAAGSSTTFCQGGSVTLSLNATTATAAYPNYQWRNNGTAIAGANAASYNATTTGSYSLTLMDSTGCGSTSAARVITVNPAPVASVTASGPTTFCSGGSVMLSAVSYPSQTYKWFLNGTVYSTILSHTITTSGTYQLQARLGNCFATSPAIPVTVNSLPAAAIITSGPNAICSGSSVLLEASPNNASNTYVWKRGAAVLPSTTAQHNANATGNYRVTITDTNGCTRTSSLYALTVATTPAATITALGSTTIGATGSVTLQANSGTGFTYQWFRNNLAIGGATTQSFRATSGGSYTVRVTSGACSQTSAARVVTQTASKEALGVTSNNVLEEAFSFSAFPNPADNSVTVRTNGAVSQSAVVQVMSLTGAAVKEVEMKDGQTEIDLSGMASGIYLLRYKDAEGRTGIIRLQKQ